MARWMVVIDKLDGGSVGWVEAETELDALIKWTGSPGYSDDEPAYVIPADQVRHFEPKSVWTQVVEGE